MDIQTINYYDAGYPEMLRHISDPPRQLYYRGTLLPPDSLCLGVVGTRKIATYGRSVTPELVAPLARAGIVIVSGMAYGVDALAHQTALDAGGRTIAVLAGGLDDATLYPRSHVLLAHQILDSGGLLLSEYPPGTPPMQHHFLARNRIISGLSVGVLVTECAAKSGALVTAHYANDQGRNVYAVPGPIYSLACAGPNNLIKDGAIPVTEAADILKDLNLDVSVLHKPRASGLTPEEQVVLRILGKNPVLLDDMVARSALSPGTVTATLTFLEMKGYVSNVGGQQYVRKKF